MKKIIYSLLFVITAVCAACDEELPKASFDLYELKTLTATAGDMNVALSWEAYPDARPYEYPGFCHNNSVLLILSNSVLGIGYRNWKS